MNHTIIVGTDLNGRKITCSIPDTTEITEQKIIAKVNNNNYIAENKMTVDGQTGECSVGYYHYLNGETEETAIFYLKNSSEVVTNLTNFKLPDDFGVCTEIDDTAVLYDYLTRNCHEKVYVICEDFCKEESLSKEGIKNEVRGYGVPTNSVMGFDGTEEDIPGGYELSDEPIGSGGDSVPIGTEVDYDGTEVPSGWEEIENDSGNLTLNSSPFTQYHKIGNVCMLKIGDYTQRTLASFETLELGTLSENYIPVMYLRTPIMIKNSSNQILNGAYLEIDNSNGKVKLGNWSNTSITFSAVEGYITYLTSNSNIETTNNTSVTSNDDPISEEATI